MSRKYSSTLSENRALFIFVRTSIHQSFDNGLAITLKRDTLISASGCHLQRNKKSSSFTFRHSTKRWTPSCLCPPELSQKQIPTTKWDSAWKRVQSTLHLRYPSNTFVQDCRGVGSQSIHLWGRSLQQHPCRFYKLISRDTFDGGKLSKRLHHGLL
jgi:hypothetical protein